MKIMVFGASGFVGGSVVSALSKEHDVYVAGKDFSDSERSCGVDLTDSASVKDCISRVSPEIIVNAAGIVENNEKAQLNVTFTRNILEAVRSLGMLPRVVVCGSAAEYGIVEPDQIPVKEDTPLNPTSMYGESKYQESKLALEYKNKYGIPVVVARIFNPIGVGMHSRFLLSNIIRTLKFTDSEHAKFEVNRKDAKRDYINVEDVALAIKALAEARVLKHDVYNIGSGVATSNEALILSVAKSLGINDVEILETSDEQEPLVAIQADISRLQEELRWKPKTTTEDTIKELAGKL
jgi:GDP-4-dehydro-6-deoxy-D-mannose reductase